MVRVYRSQNLAMVELIRGVLQDEGIPSMIRNEYVSMASGSVPIADAMPEVWLVNDSDLDRAKAIIEHGYPVEDGEAD